MSIVEGSSWQQGGEWIECETLEEGRPEGCGRRGEGSEQRAWQWGP